MQINSNLRFAILHRICSLKCITISTSTHARRTENSVSTSVQIDDYMTYPTSFHEKLISVSGTQTMHLIFDIENWKRDIWDWFRTVSCPFSWHNLNCCCCCLSCCSSRCINYLVKEGGQIDEITLFVTTSLQYYYYYYYPAYRKPLALSMTTNKPHNSIANKALHSLYPSPCFDIERLSAFSRWHVLRAFPI